MSSGQCENPIHSIGQNCVLLRFMSSRFDEQQNKIRKKIHESPFYLHNSSLSIGEGALEKNVWKKPFWRGSGVDTTVNRVPRPSINSFCFFLVNATRWISVGDVKYTASPPLPKRNVRNTLKSEIYLKNLRTWQGNRLLKEAPSTWSSCTTTFIVDDFDTRYSRNTIRDTRRKWRE